MAVGSMIQVLGRILLGTYLAAQLKITNAFIKNSEEKRDQNYVVGEKIQQLTNVAQEAQDVIDDFEDAVENQRKSSILHKMGRYMGYIYRYSLDGETGDPAQISLLFSQII
ncbi:hypothetical protein Ancab_028326 [Ancistrocladus abbreviatus]